MPDIKYLVVTLRKEVASEDEAKALADIVRAKLSDQPDILTTAMTTQKFEKPEPE